MTVVTDGILSTAMTERTMVNDLTVMTDEAVRTARDIGD